MVTNKEVLDIMNQADEIQQTVIPNCSSNALTVAEAYKLALLAEIARNIHGVDVSITASTY